MRERPVLAPAGHAAVHQPRVACVAFGGAQPQPLHHAGAEALDEHVGFLDGIEHGLRSAFSAQVDLQRAATAREDVVRRGASAGALDADHLRAHVGEQHRAERTGADARHFDHPKALQWTSHGLSPVCGGILAPAPRRRIVESDECATPMLEPGRRAASPRGAGARTADRTAPR